MLDVLIAVGLLSILLVTVYLSVTGGFDVSFESGGGTAVEAQRVRYGDAIIEPEPPRREGYVFAGWYADENFSQKFDFNNATATGSITLYALWYVS